MPYELVLSATRKEGISPDEFRKHYEEVHVPLLVSLTGNLFPLSHIRYYVNRTENSGASEDKSNTRYPATALMGSQEDFFFDSHAHLIFEDEAALHKFMAKIHEPEIAAQVSADEASFVKAGSLRAVVLDTGYQTKRPGL